MKLKRTLGAGLMIGASAALLAAFAAMADPMPPERDLSGLKFERISKDALFTYEALPEYHEAPFLDQLVADGKLPPVAERLPKEPMVYKAGAMSDGLGVYGGIFRHVTGGRPEGFNWMAGQNQGWGGIDYAIQECLVRQGPRWQIRTEDQTGPLPNLAKSWEWNDTRTELTMHLVEGIKWSDGDPFDTDDVAFWWNDNVEDPKVTSRMAAGSFGGGAKMDVIDAYTFKFTFPSPQSETIIDNLAFIQGCPGPSHILKPLHPKYNKDATYESYTAALPADKPLIPVLGAWAPVKHLPDQVVILRRNPYFWKVDEAGNQLPYIDEMQFKLTTWDDRTTQAIAGTSDFANVDNPGNFVEALKQSQDPNAPVSAKFGPRTQVWRIDLNLSEDLGATDYDKELRHLFREKDFRAALSYGLDRDALGQSLARGPFSYPYMGGLVSGSPYYNADATFFSPFDAAKAAELLAGLGLKDTDGNGILNLPGVGEDLTIDISFNSAMTEMRKLLDSVTSQYAEIGVRVLAKPLDEASIGPLYNSGALNAMLERPEFMLPTRRDCDNMPITDTCPGFHMKGPNERQLLPFETELVVLHDKFNASDDTVEQAKIADQMQTLITENFYTIGLVQTPVALLVNKKIKNAHPSTPVFMYDWAEDGIMRERLWIPQEDQVPENELLPGTIAEY